jgi:hypothetical protein
MQPVFERAAELLSEVVEERRRALIAVGLDFGCWRVLSQSLGPPAAAALLAEAIVADPTN